MKKWFLILLVISTSTSAVEPNFDTSSGIVSFPRVTVNNDIALVNVQLLLSPDGTWTILEATQEEPITSDLTGKYSGTFTSNVSPDFDSIFTGSLVQNGNELTGISVTHNPSLEGGSLESVLTGEINNGNVTLTSLVGDFVLGSFVGTVSSDNKTISGSYKLPGFENDHGSWALTFE